MVNRHSLLESIRDGLSETVAEITNLNWVRDLPGGDINRAGLIDSGDQRWFVKYHSNPPEGMFVTEAQALAELASHNCIRVPSPVALGSDDGTGWLVLEYLELRSKGPASLLGEQIAAMHTVSNRQYGWKRDNYIGSTVQLNGKSDNWTEFWGRLSFGTTTRACRSCRFQ